MTDDEVIRLCSLIWNGKKLRNLADPRMGKDDTWHDIILACEEVVLDMVRLSLTSSLKGSRCGIVRRCAIDHAIRGVTNSPCLYTRPLYVSEGHLLRIAEAETAMLATPGRRRTVREPSCREEHVVPLAVDASGRKILEDPEGHLRRVRRKFMSPVCIVTPDEDLELTRIKDRLKGHERPNRPFQRYADVADIRLTRNGARIDPASFTFRDHLREMSMQPAYATAVPLFASGSRHWVAALAALRRDVRTPRCP